MCYQRAQAVWDIGNAVDDKGVCVTREYTVHKVLSETWQLGTVDSRYHYCTFHTGWPCGKICLQTCSIFHPLRLLNHSPDFVGKVTVKLAYGQRFRSVLTD
jgi:hypothetical protein